MLLCIQTSKVISDPGRFKFSTDELYFKPPDVMARQFSWCPEALSNTMEVAERCDLKLKFGENHFPIFPVPAGESLESLFEHACLITSVKNTAAASTKLLTSDAVSG